MKRTVLFLTVTAFLVILVTPSFASLTADQFNAGAKTIVMSPLKVSDNIKSETENAKFFPFALVGGLVKGGFYMAKDIVTGVVDVVTSPFASMKK